MYDKFRTEKGGELAEGRRKHAAEFYENPPNEVRESCANGKREPSEHIGAE